MTHEERSLIQNLDKCDFGEMHAMHKAKVEARKSMTKEEKLVRFRLFFSACVCCRFHNLQYSPPVSVDHLITVEFNYYLLLFYFCCRL